MGVSPHMRIRWAAAKREEKRREHGKKEIFKTELPDGAPDFGGMKLDELRAYAKENSIDIKGLTKKEDICARLTLRYLEAINNASDKAPEGEASAHINGDGEGADGKGVSGEETATPKAEGTDGGSDAVPKTEGADADDGGDA